MFAPEDLRRHAGKFYGKYAGEVTSNEDEAHLGRVRVRVPTIFREGPVWARPCFPPGHFFVPPVGAKVWIEFEAGDTRFPLWVGVYHPSSTIPPEAARSPPDNRVVHTPSGHTIELLDQEGEEKVLIRHKGDAFLVLDKDGGVVLSNKNGSHLHLNAKDGGATFVEEHGHMLTMGASGAVLVNKDGAMLELRGNSARLMAADVLLQATNVALGANATEPTLLGNTFAQMWNAFLLHTHPSAMGPTGPAIPVPPVGPLTPMTGLTSSVVVK